jgi:hypothetical protein
MNNKIGKNDTIYTPINKEKYIGKSSWAVCRSSWERKMCQWLDNNPYVVKWASEPLSIPYIDNTQKDYKGMPKKRKYYPDYLCHILNQNNKIDIWLIEIKPYKETLPPTKGKNKSRKTQVYEAKTYSVNQSKWKSAENYCKKRGWKFKILTEKQLLK